LSEKIYQAMDVMQLLRAQIDILEDENSRLVAELEACMPIEVTMED